MLSSHNKVGRGREKWQAACPARDSVAPAPVVVAAAAAAPVAPRQQLKRAKN